MIEGIIAVVLGYLLGSIPTAYIVTRVALGKDIRSLGGGNVGGLNVFREVGLLPAAIVGVVDVAKGVAAVTIAYWLIGVSPVFVLATALAVVAGHNWMLFLRFSGGKGMGAAVGGLFILFPLYDYPIGLAFFFAVILIPFVVTRNVALSMGIGLIALPFIAWLGLHSSQFVIFSVILGLVILLKFVPTAIEALRRTRGAKDFIFDRGKRDRG